MSLHATATLSARVLFWIWVPLALALGTTLLATHWHSLPVPEDRDGRLDVELAGLRTHGDQDRWLVVHVLYAACGCSRNVLEHLVHDPRPSDLAERIVMVGTNPEIDALLLSSPLPIVRLDERELAERFAIEAAPLLLVVDPQGTLRYRGGYTEHKQGKLLRDVAIIDGLRADHDVAALPLFGCAVTDRLRRLLDPFGLRGATADTDGPP